MTVNELLNQDFEVCVYGPTTVQIYKWLIITSIILCIFFFIRLLVLGIRKDEKKTWKIIRCIFIYGTMFISIIPLYGITYLNLGKATYDTEAINKYEQITNIFFNVFVIFIIVELVINRKKKRAK